MSRNKASPILLHSYRFFFFLQHPSQRASNTRSLSVEPPQATWEHCVSTSAPYYPSTYEQDGFIHLTKDPSFLLKVANHFYREPADTEWILLVIDGAKLTSEVKYEPAAPVGDKQQPVGDDVPLFPHLFGTINFSAVVRTCPMTRSAEGEFLSIDGM